MVGSTQNSMRFVWEIASFVSKPLFMGFQMQLKIEFCVLVKVITKKHIKLKTLVWPQPGSRKWADQGCGGLKKSILRLLYLDVAWDLLLLFLCFFPIHLPEHFWGQHNLECISHNNFEVPRTIPTPKKPLDISIQFRPNYFWKANTICAIMYLMWMVTQIDRFPNIAWSH